MDRSGAARLLGATATLIAVALPFALLVVLEQLPAIQFAGTAVAWVPVSLIIAMGGIGAIVAVTLLASGLRHGDPASLASAGASAALAGGAVAVLSGAASLALPVLATALLMVTAGALRASGAHVSRPRAMGLAAVALVAAEAAAVGGVLPATAESVAALGAPILIGALALAGVAGIMPAGIGLGAGAFTAVGAFGLLADRDGSLELAIGLAALIAGQLIILREALSPAPEDRMADDSSLPELAAQLSEAVLRFDGRLQLRDWNQRAASLLGLDHTATGTRMEDLLGVSMGDLPAPGGTAVSPAIGGLDIVMHRSGGGVTAVIRDPGATPEGERLGAELRGTIEELLRARRTIDLQRGEIERSAAIDALTGVGSRGSILERLRIELAQARRYRHPLAVVLIDVDGFGDLNREYGIAAGDGILREVALRIRLRVREADALGRAGSDGFLGILPHTDDAGAATFADALRHRLALRPIVIGDASVQVTVSIGVAAIRAGEELDVDGLLARVDEALASARGAGGDRIALDRLHGLARLEDSHQTAQDSGL